MKTYQDLLQVGEDEAARAAFVLTCINEHKGGELYKWAKLGDDYSRGQNTTIKSYQKTLTNVTGEVVPDEWSATHRSASNFFQIITTQLNQFELGNGVEWENEQTAERLGADFDTRLQRAGYEALCAGASCGFFNNDHLEVFSALEFAPLYDEENGALRAGIRFWQVDASKPMRATLYEEGGYTNYLWAKQYEPTDDWTKIADQTYSMNKRAYIIHVTQSEADGEIIYDGKNYDTFPIVPLWANPQKQSELVNLQEKIDAYDFILNGFEDDLDNAQLYWIIKGAGGMDDIDLTQFLDRLRTVKAAAPADGQEIAPVQVNIPYAAREQLLTRLERQIYRDAMILNPDYIAGGAATATQIRAAYEPQNVKADQYEYCLIDFVQGILKIAGIEDNPTFTRSMVVNKQEEVQVLVQAAQFLSPEYVTRKILSLFGDADKADEILAQMERSEMERMALAIGQAQGEEQSAQEEPEAQAEEAEV